MCYYMQSNVVKHNCNNRVRGWVTDINMVIMWLSVAISGQAPTCDPSSCGDLTSHIRVIGLG